MRYDFLFSVLLYIMAAFLLVGAIFLFSRKRQLPGLILSGLFVMANAIYAMGYASFVFADLETYKLLLNHVMHISIPYLAPLWLLLAFKLRRPNQKLPFGLIVGIMVIPFISMIANFAYRMDGKWFQTLYYVAHTIRSDVLPHWTGYTVLIYQKGILYYVLMGYSAIVLGWACALFYRGYRQNEFLAKTRSLILFSISLVGFVLLTLSVISTKTVFIDYTPFFTALFALVLFFTLFHYELFDLVPKAYQLVFMQSQNPIFILDASFQIVHMNQKAKSLFFAESELKSGFTLNHLLPNIEIDFESTLLGNALEIELPIETDKRTFSLELLVLKNRYFGRNYNGYCLTFFDITEHKKEMEVMEKMASYDGLTQIYNRRYFYHLATEMFDDAQIQMKNIAVVMFDLDDFKIVNDIYGHQAGDYVLEELAQFLKTRFPKEGIFARYGGEEFIYMVTNVTINDVKKLISSLCKEVATHPFVYSERKMKITASFGVSGSMKSIEKSLETYIKEADDMLYCSKGNGKNQVFFTKDIQ